MNRRLAAAFFTMARRWNATNPHGPSADPIFPARHEHSAMGMTLSEQTIHERVKQSQIRGTRPASPIGSPPWGTANGVPNASGKSGPFRGVRSPPCELVRWIIGKAMHQSRGVAIKHSTRRSTLLVLSYGQTPSLRFVGRCISSR